MLEGREREPSILMIGTQVGQFVIQRLLGQGGMGAVYLAEHAVLKTPRAVKVLLPEWTRSQQIVQRFVNEARAAAAIRHRNIIEVHDVGQLPGGQWFMLLDYVEGQTLAQLIRAQGEPLAPERIVHIVSEIANGLQAAHEHDIVHRDLKPDNIYLSAWDGDEHRVTILDFGVARLGAGANLVTRTGTIIGTPAFMAPEQLRGEKVGPAADIFALAVIAYQMTTGGRLPHEDAGASRAYHELTAAQIYHRQMSSSPVDPRRYAAGTSEAWVRALASALDVDPARRPPTAGAFARLLAAALPGDRGGPSGLDIVRTYARELLGPAGAPLGEPAPARPPAQGGGRGSRYRLGSRLGAGGMAEVFIGTMIGAEGFARPVAIKRVLAGHSEAPRFAAMFVEEARIASRLSHPNIVSVLDFDRDEDGRLILVMELVEGKDLEALCAVERPPPSIAIFVASEILRGLGYAHELPHPGGARGYVHRDVSPHNVLVSWEGAVKVSDFGIAKALEATMGARSAMVKGKPAYMSPEQVSAELLDGRSDLFAVGIILWELLAGRKLFTGGMRETFAQILFQEHPRPSELTAGVPADLEVVVMRLLARDREERYPTAEAAIDALARCADNPRNGRSELVRWMARRFPDEIARRIPAPCRERAAPQTADPEQQITTLDAVASQSTPHAEPRRRRGAWLGVAVAICTLTAVATATLATRVTLHERGRAEPTAPPAAMRPPATPPNRAEPARLEPARPGPPPASASAKPEGAAALLTRSPVSRPGGPPGSDPSHAVGPAGGPAPPTGAPTPRRARAVDANAPLTPPVDRGARRPSAERGVLLVHVQPWAEVWIDGAPAGQTPVQAIVRTGAHRVLLKNDHRQKTIAVTVTTAGETVIEESW